MKATVNDKGEYVIIDTLPWTDDNNVLIPDDVQIKGLELWPELGSYVDLYGGYTRTKVADYLIGRGSMHVVNGKPEITTKLFIDKELAKYAWELASRGKLEYDIEGVIKKRNGNEITEIEVHKVNLIRIPNKDCS